uniref:Odorant binding protein n=1 Tax=Anopheles epiroticus TaxID=199890 RepID=A0A9I3FGM2_9DIPT
MKRLLLSVVLALVPLAALANDTKGLTIEKSFLQSVHDCVEYLQVPRHRLVQYLAYEFPPDEETKCLIYCVGTDLRWWNNTCGLQVPAIVNFFQPVLGDRQYEKRTSECLERNVLSATTPNNCCKAYETFQCYFREFGNIVTCPQYVPPTKLQATQAALDCLNMLRIPTDLLQCYSKGDLPDVQETRCLYHCFDHRIGLYTFESGVHLSRLYVRDLAFHDLRYLSKETKACRDRVRASGCDVCSEVYNTHHDCLAGIGDDDYTSRIVVEAARIALANLGVCCQEKQVPLPLSAEEVEEVGYSYASYQPSVPKELFPPVLPVPELPVSVVTRTVPVYGHRPSCSSCGSSSKVVVADEVHPTLYRSGSYAMDERPQHAVSSDILLAPSEPSTGTSSYRISKPSKVKSVPAVLSYPDRSSSYPSFRSCKAEHFGFKH